MSTRFDIPEWLSQEPAPPPPPVDDHRLEGLVNRFIAGKQEALFTAPDAFYRRGGGDAVDGAPAIADRLQALRTALLDQAVDDGERAALGPRLDLHVADAMDGIGRHVAAQRTVHQRQVIAERQALIRRAAELEHDNDDKIAGLADAQASAARELARLDGVAPDSPEEGAAQDAARSQILRAAIEQRIGAGRPGHAVTLYDRVKATLSPADRRALELPIGAATDDAATDAWLAREIATDGAPLSERAGLDHGLSDTQRLILLAKIGARDSGEHSRRFATVKGLDDRLAEATATIATQPSLYRPGTLSALAEAYTDAGAPEKADETRRLALQERYFLPFAQAGAAAQQRHLQDLAGPERAMAEAILRHQDVAFARDHYAAGTALYPEVGPPLPEDDAEGRLRQARMIEARRGTSSTTPLQIVRYEPSNERAPKTMPAPSGGQAPFTGSEPSPGSSAFLVADTEARRVANDEPRPKDNGSGNSPLATFYEGLVPDPEAEYGTILPIKVDSKGLHLALPMILRSGLKGYLDLMTSIDTGVLTPEAMQALVFGNPTIGMLGAPRGALGSFGARGGRRGLPMDMESRMARAEEMGFRKLPITYHGTNKDIAPGFLLNPPTRATTASTAKAGIWTAENPEVAAFYANEAAGTSAPKGQNIIPIRARADKVAVVDAKDAKMTDMAVTILDAWDRGYDAIRVINVGWNGKPETFWVFKDPKQLRSPHAKFDPAERDSGNLLSGKAVPAPAALPPDRQSLPNNTRPIRDIEI